MHDKANGTAAQLDRQAALLNERIGESCPAVLEMLSARGKAIYFPKLGILSQSADAKGKEINATMGIALEENGEPMRLAAIAEQMKLAPSQVFPYAPSAGRPDLREKWKEMLVKKNPALSGKQFSLPVVTCALTHGLSICGYLFCDEGDSVILPDLYWENYDLIFRLGYGAKLDTFPTFDGNRKFNVSGLRDRLLSRRGGKIILCFNFPNNPAGYTPTREEIGRLTSALREAAEAGSKIIALIDDAYFGLAFENNIYDQSVFCELCDLHSNLLAIKLDGPTKEDYVWGFRVGFITYGIKDCDPGLYEALEAKTAGAIRGNISNAPNVCQSLLASAWATEKYDSQKIEKREILKRRYEKVKSILASHPEYEDYFVALPFNSGYFMCVKIKEIDADKLRRKLLDKYSTGIITFGQVVRIAYSSVPTQKLETLFDNIYRAAQELAGV